MLFVAAVVSLICYKPLGLPDPDGSNLALGILLFVVICIQGIFNAWQDWVLSSFLHSPSHSTL
jgi:sodium/potassium-transporting ATPase subunit alpha